MPHYLLVPKEESFESAELGVEDAEEARERIAESADGFALDAAYTLQEMGLRPAEDVVDEDVPARDRIAAAALPGEPETPEPVDAGGPSFSRLPYVGAVAAAFEDEDQANEAAKRLPDYDLVPDIPLILTQQVGATGVLIDADDASPEWPEESGVDGAHQGGVRGKGVFVGVIDSGFDADHKEFTEDPHPFRYVSPLSRMQQPTYRSIRGFDMTGHGTHVSGIIAGATTGIAPEASLHVASVIESEQHRTSLIRLFFAMNWIDKLIVEPENRQKPAIVNMSLGWKDGWLNASELGLLRGAIHRMFRTLTRLNVLLVVAVGNDGPGTVRGPGYFAEAFAVGAVDFSEVPTSTSGGGPSPLTQQVKPDIAGYGNRVISSVERSHANKSFYTRKSGTSMAAAYVSGIAALYASADPTLKGSQLRGKIVSTAKKLPLYPRDRVGDGLARYV